MTFSVDVDFWPFQAGPLQDATTRQGAGEGRGKDFASSLFGIAPDVAPSADLILGEHDGITLASLNLLPLAPDAPEVPLASAPLSPAEGLTLTPVLESETLPPDTPPETDTAATVAAEDQQPIAPEAVPPAEIPLTAPQDDAAVLDEAIETETADFATAKPIVPADKPADQPVEGGLNMTQPVPVQAVPLMPLQTGMATAVAVNAAAPKASPPDAAQPAQSSRRATAAASTEAATQIEASTEMAAVASDEVVSAMNDAGFDTGKNADQGTGSETVLPASTNLLAGGPVQAAPGGQTPANPVVAQMTPTHAVLTATATQLPDIVARATSDGSDDRVVVQLDPPELGRVSIDFKFDAQGLQHVTITAESPEAMRQLRQMHFELVQALERNGLSGQNMSFQHQNPQQNEGWGPQAKFTGARFDSPALTGTGLIIAADTLPHRQTASSGRLDIKL